MEGQGKIDKPDRERISENSKLPNSKHLEGLSEEEKKVVELISNILIKYLLDEGNF